jgi:predicted nuclease of predicted toxin-antitoxin system
MRLLLDQGLPRSTVPHLGKEGIEALHVGEIGLASASDAKILEFGLQEHRVVVTLDADFHALLAISGAKEPSVIRIRIEGLGAEDHARLLAHALSACKEDLEKGAMVTVTENGIRIRQLPLLR